MTVLIERKSVVGHT